MVKKTKRTGWIAWAKRLNKFQKLLLACGVFLVACVLIIAVDVAVRGDQIRQVSMLGPP